MFTLTELEYVLMYQVKEKETNVVLKMLLKKRAKTQQEIKHCSVKGLQFFLIVHLYT